MNDSVHENETSTSATVIVNCVLNVPLMLISTVGNTLVLVAIFTTPSLRSMPSIVLLCGLAASDFAVGLLVQPLFIAKELTSSFVLVRLSSTISSSLCGISVSTMAVISVDRLLALQYHMTYNTVVTTPRAIVAIVIIWLFNFAMSAVRVFHMPNHFYAANVLLSIYTLTATISYIGIHRIVRRHQLQIQVQRQAVQSSNAENTLNIVSLKRTAINTFVFYICLILCYFPWFICQIYYNDTADANTKPVWLFTVTLVFANSSINPFLYGWRLRELRIAIVKAVRKISCKQTGAN